MSERPFKRVGPRAFRLERITDVSGVSGTGFVAEGVEFSDGTVALRWLSDWPTSVVFHDRGMAAVEKVHGHGGATRIRWACAYCGDISAEFDAFCVKCAVAASSSREHTMSDETRYVWRVVIDGNPVNHYQTRRAAEYRAAYWSNVYEGMIVRVERSLPVEFEPDAGIHVHGVWRNGKRI
mgnify:CR=1 FL=1